MIATLGRDSLRLAAPSVFASAPWERVSGNYRFVPTSNVLDIMEAEGLRVTQAMQSITRIPGKGTTSATLLRLRHDRYITLDPGEEIPEIVLVNSHDLSSAYKIFTGIFRLVCSNGAMIQSADFGGVSIRHSGSRDLREQVIDTAAPILAETPDIMGKIAGWKAIELDQRQRHAPASAALGTEGQPGGHPSPAPGAPAGRGQEDRPLDHLAGDPGRSTSSRAGTGAGHAPAAAPPRGPSRASRRI